MSEKTLFSEEDCLQTGYEMSIDGKVIVLHSSALPKDFVQAKYQMYFCTGGNGSKPNPIGRSIFTVSLAEGEKIRWNRNDVLGILKPELLPEHARLQLSQIRPSGALDLKTNEPQYSGYCFLPDGRYTSGVSLCNAKEVQDYIEMQKDYQHGVMICDRDDFCVFEMIDGKLIYPSTEAMEVFRKEQQEQGGMELKL
jgi:hypothetical protein